MQGLSLEFKQRVITDVDAFNNPTGEIVGITVDNCLIAPNMEPEAARANQAMHQSRDIVQIHLPKTFTADLGNSYVAYSGKIFQLDSSSVYFMDENTPGPWNRYFKAESVGQYDENEPDVWLHFFVTEDSRFYLSTEAS